MRVLLQRIACGSVSENGAEVAAAGPGLLLLTGFGKLDTPDDVEWMLRKVLSLRVFPDDRGSMNLSVTDTDGDLLIVSQFTLHAMTSKGRRPSFVRAGRPADAVILYDLFIELAKASGLRVASGNFGAMMDVELVNTGPVTIMLESPSERAE